MRQLTLTEDKKLEWWDVEEPRLQDDRDAIVRPLAVSACDLDTPMARGLAPLPGPIALGHEFVAEVADGVAAAAAASASDNVVDAWRTVGPFVQGRPGLEVLIVGGSAHSIALYAVEFAVALGAGRVAYLDSDEARLALAASLGAETIEG